MYITAKISVFLVVVLICFIIGFAVGAHCMNKAIEHDKSENNQDEQYVVHGGVPNGTPLFLFFLVRFRLTISAGYDIIKP